jgi:DNA-directed RNA polymerase subunit RPC12/RpoP
MPENYEECEIIIKFKCVSCKREVWKRMNPDSIASAILETGETNPPSTGLHIYCPECGYRNYFRFN